MPDGQTGGMSEVDRRLRDLEALEALYARWARGDFGFIEPFADDAVWVFADAIEAGEYTGLEQITAAWRTWLQSWEEFQIKATEVIPGPEGKYLVMQTFRGKGKSSGIESTNETALVATMRDGKIARMEGYWDLDAARRALSDKGTAE